MQETSELQYVSLFKAGTKIASYRALELHIMNNVLFTGKIIGKLSKILSAYIFGKALCSYAKP